MYNDIINTIHPNAYSCFFIIIIIEFVQRNGMNKY